MYFRNFENNRKAVFKKKYIAKHIVNFFLLLFFLTSISQLYRLKLQEVRNFPYLAKNLRLFSDGFGQHLDSNIFFGVLWLTGSLRSEYLRCTENVSQSIALHSM